MSVLDAADEVHGEKSCERESVLSFPKKAEKHGSFENADKPEKTGRLERHDPEGHEIGENHGHGHDHCDHHEHHGYCDYHAHHACEKVENG